MSDTQTAKYYNGTADAQIKSSAGTLYGIIVSSHSSGTFEFNDGFTATEAGDKATQTLTTSGACVPGVYAQSVVTASTIIDGDTLTIGAITYRFKSTPAQAYDVNLGANDAAALDNLKLAINASGTGDGSDYYAGTVAHEHVIATTNTDTAQTIVARVIGTTANSLATTSTGGTLTWEDTTLGGGTGASVTGVATTAATITIDSETYTAVTSLAETHGLTAIPYQVLWVTSEAVFLDNLKSAINNGGTEGTDYGTGTPAHSSVSATTNTDTTQVVESLVVGTASNSIAVSTTLANYAWGAATLAGGTEPAALIVNTFSAATGSQIYEFPRGIEFYNGLYINIGGTIDYTVIYI